MVLASELGAAAVSILIDRFVSAPRRAPRTLLRYALTAVIYLLGVIISICCVTAARPTVRKLITTPNQLFSRDWKFQTTASAKLAGTASSGRRDRHLLALWVAKIVTA